MNAKARTKKNRISRIWQTVLIGILSLIIGLSVYAWNARSLLGDQVPMPFGVGTSVVLSGSMEPTLSVGDLLIIRQQAHYETDDIVVYQSGTVPVVHRIVEISDESVTTRGDANNVDDESFPVEAIKGEVVAAIPWLGYGVWALKSPVAVIVMLAAAVFLIEASFRTGKAEKEAEKEKLKEEIRALLKELEEK